MFGFFSTITQEKYNLGNNVQNTVNTSRILLLLNVLCEKCNFKMDKGFFKACAWFAN